jgi:YVTN family beta-propeller protein
MKIVKSALPMMAASVLCIAGGCGKVEVVESPAPSSEYVSPEFLALSADCQSVFATSATGSRILNVSLDGFASRTWKVTSVSAGVPVNPTGIAVAKNGSVFVTCGVQSGELQEYKADGTLVKSALVGHSPCAPVVSADGKTVYVMNRFQAKVSVVDVASMKVKSTVSVLREPFAAALGAGDKYLFVANMLPYCAATDDHVAASISVIDTKSLAVKNILLPNGSTGVRGMGKSPDGKSIYVTHSMGRYQLPTTQLERGWMNTAAMSIFCGETGAYVNTVLLDDSDRGAANPWGVTVTEDGKTIVVAHAGTREVSIIDRAALHERLRKAEKGESVSGIVKSKADVLNDLAFLVSIRRRVNINGEGPRGIVTVGRQAITALYFDDSLASFPLDEKYINVAQWPVGPKKDINKDLARKGEMLYNSGYACFQQWQSCASCHPDGRVDGLNWDLLNDGVGNPKQTKSEIYTQWTPPTMVTGIRKDMHVGNRAGFVHIQFANRPEEDVNCVDAYITQMKPVPSPYLVNGQLSAAAKRGEALFKQAKCDTCHSAELKGPNGEVLWTDLTKYDVGVGVATEKGKAFDTPTLAECWRSAPYLYDGRALTMEEVLTKFNPGDQHGETSKLKPNEIKDLAEYILSL